MILRILFFSIASQTALAQNPSGYVNPFVGTGAHGHTYPGASMPFGMVQLSPDTRLSGWDGCSGYHYSDSVIYGFSHTHLSGTGVADYCDILLMPSAGNAVLQRGDEKNTAEGYCSSFSHANEKASPGFYSVKLFDHNIDVSLTCTPRTGIHQYNFNGAENPHAILDLTHRDKVLESEIIILNDLEVAGFRRSSSWANDQRLYFLIRFSEPFTASGIATNDSVKNISSLKGNHLKAFFQFDLKKNKPLIVKVALSAVSIEGAKKNMEAEAPHFDFEKYQSAATQAWNKELSKIMVTGGTEQQRKTFYTALYHTLLNPNIYADVDGSYRGRDLNIHKADGYNYYTVFSLWDTYRAEHPLLSIIDKKRTTDFIKTFIVQHEQGGLLPVWELSANETNCMIGYHAVPVIADAYMKGIRDYDVEKAYAACKASAMKSNKGLDALRSNGFISIRDESESVSKTLEYAYDDWCIAQMAKSLGKEEDFKYFTERAQAWKNLFDPSTGFMRPKSNQAFLSPFDPREVNNHFTEANSWQYSFYVPQDINTLMDWMGGKEKFASKLDELFTSDSRTTGREQSDITGLIGQYAHGNEPSHHAAYLYSFAGKPVKAQSMAKRIMKTLYDDSPEGLCGNEDCGQMSAWYVLSAMGFYPVAPASNQYILGSPLFDKAVISLESGKTFTVLATNISTDNNFVKEIKWNGLPYNKSFITHDIIESGGTIEFVMANEPGKNLNDLEAPEIKITEQLIVPVPYCENASRTFSDSMVLSLKHPDAEVTIFYSFKEDSKTPDESFIQYSFPVKLFNAGTLKLKARDNNGNESKTIEAAFYKIRNDRSVKIMSEYNRQYTAGGDMGLIDGIRGTEDWRTGSWQGYQDTDFVAVVELKTMQIIKKLSAGFLQDVQSWIWMPTRVEFSVSSDGKNFNKVLEIKNEVGDSDYKVQVKDFAGTIAPVSAKYIKVQAFNYGTIPEWHPGAGGEAFIFTDEVMVE